MGLNFPVAHAAEEPWHVGVSTSHEYFDGHFLKNAYMRAVRAATVHDLRIHGRYQWRLSGIDMGILAQWRKGWTTTEQLDTSRSVLVVDYSLMNLATEDSLGFIFDSGIKFSHWRDILGDYSNINPGLHASKAIGPVTLRIKSGVSILLGVAAQTSQMGNIHIGYVITQPCSFLKSQRGPDQFQCLVGGASYLQVKNQFDVDAELLPGLIFGYSLAVNNHLIATSPVQDDFTPPGVQADGERWSHVFISHLRLSYDMKDWFDDWWGLELSLRSELGALANHSMFDPDGTFIPPFIFNIMDRGTNKMRIYWSLAFEY